MIDQILQEVKQEQERAAKKWGVDFDDKNTANDWVAYITRYAGMAVTFPFNRTAFEDNMVKVAGLAASAVASSRTGGPAPRHYDEDVDWSVLS